MTQIFDPRQKQNFEEKVFGESFINWSFGTGLGRAITGLGIVQKTVSRFVGSYYKSGLSKKEIAPFIKNFDIQMDEFVEPTEGYNSFNDFFIRQLKPGQRKFPRAAQELGACAEGRLSVFPLQTLSDRIVIKGQNVAWWQLVESEAQAKPFVGGHAFVFRLCPVDYHRFHFPDAGTASKSKRIAGLLLSVNPLALSHFNDIFIKNERQYTFLKSANFGELALIEVGALCVGAIAQSYAPEQPVTRGQEKGYFEFGGSTCIMLCGPQIQPEALFLEKTAAGVESYVKLGDTVAKFAG